MTAIVDAPFAFRTTAGGEVRIERGGRVVTVLRAAAASAFLRKVEGASEAERQLAMARATGNYRRGNERAGGRHPRRQQG